MANRAEGQPVPQRPVVQQQGDERPFSPLRVLEEYKLRHPELFVQPPLQEESSKILLEPPVHFISHSVTPTGGVERD